MKVFVAGATGAIGRPLIRQLLARGHQVVGMTRSEANARQLRETGAEAVICDALNASAFIEAIVDSQPDAVVHQLTAIPDEINPRKVRQQFEATSRLRTEATRSLIAGAEKAGSRTVLAQSIAFAYRPSGTALRSEVDPLWDDPPSSFSSIVESVAELERQVTRVAAGLVLRYGFFYGPGTAYAEDGSMARLVRKRAFPLVGGADGVFSFIHVEDAATATLEALERGATGIYNVVDDEPAPVKDWLPIYADALDAPRPRRVPKFLARLLAGAYVTYMMTELRGASNAKARAELGWSPRYASWRTGFGEALG